MNELNPGPNPTSPLKVEIVVIQQEMQLLFDIQQASKILGGMPESSIRTHVHAGRLRRAEHTGDRPWYFTIEQLQNFIVNSNSPNDQ